MYSERSFDTTALLSAAGPTKSSNLLPSNSEFGNREERRVKMNRMRLRTAERLKESQNNAASLTTFNEVDMKNLMELREANKKTFEEKHGVKLGFMSTFVKATSTALQEMPILNASIDGNEIVYHDYVDISIAVATPKGLVTPVLRNVESMSFAQIEKGISEFGNKVYGTGCAELSSFRLCRTCICSFRMSNVGS